MNFMCSWSGGKDSAYAFYKALQMGYSPMVLLNVMNEKGERSRSHGITKPILEAQAEAIGLPIHFFNSTWQEYERLYIENLKKLTVKYPISHAFYGDIDIDAHRKWEEKVSNSANLKAILPLWQKDRKQLVLEMIAEGFEAIIVSCNEALGPEFLGRTIDEPLIDTFESNGIDACGENGEYHTLVVNAPYFKHRLQTELISKTSSGNYNFAELALKKTI